MPGKFITDFAEELQKITEELGEIGVPEKFIKLAEEGNVESLKEAFDQFKLENPNLWIRISDLTLKYEEDGDGVVIFGEETEELLKYDPMKIEPINLAFIILFSKGVFDDYLLFSDNKIFLTALEERGYKKIAKYLKNSTASFFKFKDLIEAVNYQE